MWCFFHSATFHQRTKFKTQFYGKHFWNKVSLTTVILLRLIFTNISAMQIMTPQPWLCPLLHIYAFDYNYIWYRKYCENIICYIYIYIYIYNIYTYNICSDILCRYTSTSLSRSNVHVVLSIGVTFSICWAFASLTVCARSQTRSKLYDSSG